MTARSFISSHRNRRRFLAATHHAPILNNYSRDVQVLHFTLERGKEKPTLMILYRSAHAQSPSLVLFYE